MAETTTLVMHDQAALVEAYDRLREASLALGGFADLLAGNPNSVNNERLYHLLHPIQLEVANAVDALAVATQFDD